MTPMKTMVSTVALAALAATPLAAQSLSGGADVGGSVSVDTGSSAADVDPGVSVGAEADTEATIDMESDPSGTAVTSIISAAEAAIAAGNAQVKSSNDTVIGTIAAVEPDGNGRVGYTIEVADHLGLEADRVTLVSRSTVASDGSLTINMTEDEFATAATQRSSTGSITSTELN